MQNNIFKTLAPTWKEKFDLSDGSCSASDIQDYFECISKNTEKDNDIPSIRIYIIKIYHRITFKTKPGYYLELFTPETMKLLRSTEKKINENKNGENIPTLEITEVILVHFNIVNNHYQSDLRVFYIFVPNKLIFKL